VALLSLQESSLQNLLNSYAPGKFTAGAVAGQLKLQIRTFIRLEVGLACNFQGGSALIPIQLSMPFLQRMLLPLVKSRLLRFPFIKEIASDHCLIDSARIPLNGGTLGDFAQIESLQIPGGPDAAVLCHFKIKE
jgi:hypothetical protein